MTISIPLSSLPNFAHISSSDTNVRYNPVHFQMSGQGPYFGQAGWFTVLHEEKLPSAISRYQREVRRIHGVLDHWLQNRQWLVGDKMTYADLAFSTWNDRSDAVLECAAEDKFKGFPNVQDWHERMTSRMSWKKAMDARARLMDEQGLTWNAKEENSNLNHLKRHGNMDENNSS